MDTKKLCFGCMNQKQKDAEKCPNCGHINGQDQKEHYYLSEGIKLNDRYIIGRVLGHGGFGITYIGFDSKLGIKVAIKEYLPSDISTRTIGETQVTTFSGDKYDAYVYGLGRFIDEAKVLAQYNEHKCIVSINDYFKENNTAYIVMEYLDGISLKEYINRSGGLISLNETLEIIRPILDALLEVHSQGMIHRDISPDNIFITKDKRIKLLDFGAARHAIGDNSRSLSVILKPGYAPPEQYFSKGEQGTWTDVYALGATMYKMLTGLTPDESVERVAEESGHILNKLVKMKLPANICYAVDKALNVDRTSRFTGVGQLYSALYEKTSEEDYDEYVKNEIANIRKAEIKNISTDIKRQFFINKKYAIAAVSAAAILLSVIVAIIIDSNKPKEEPVVEVTATEEPEDYMTAADLDQVINIPDEGLREAIVLYLEIMDEDFDGVITQWHMLKLTEMEIESPKSGESRDGPFAVSGRANITVNIESIEGLQYAKNLNRLEIQHNNITDFSPLQELENLLKLDISYNKITNLSSITGCESLESLVIDGYSFENLDDLKNLVNLGWISLQDAKVNDITALEEIPNLGGLRMNEYLYKKNEEFIQTLVDKGVRISINSLSLEDYLE